MGYLDDLLGTTKANVAPAQPAGQISGVVTAQPNATVVKPGFVGPTTPAPAPAPVKTEMPAVQKPQADNLGLQSDMGISTDANLQPAAGEQQTKLHQLFNSKVIGVDGTEAPKFKTYDEMSPLEKAQYVQKYSETATSDLLFGPNEGRNAAQKVAGYAFDLVDPFVKDISNIHLTNKIADEVAKGNVDQSVFDGIEVLKKSNLQITGDVAQAVLTAYTPSLGTNLVAQSMVKQGLKELALQGLKEGSFAGLQYGIAVAMSSGSTDPKEIAKIIALNTGIGGAGGAALSTIAPAISKVIAGTKKILADFSEALIAMGYTPEEATKLSTQGGFLGRFNPKAEELGRKLNELNKRYVEKPTPANKKALELLKKEYMTVSQGGYVKNPFVKEEMPGNKSGVKLELPKAQEADGYITSLRKTLNPINYTDDLTKKVYNNYTRALNGAAEDSNQIAKAFKDIPDKQGWESILDYEKGIPNSNSSRIKQVFDDLHTEALQKGVDVPYRENYVPQIYKNSPEEVKLAVGNYLIDQGVDHKIVQEYVNGIAELPAEVASRLKMTPNFAKARVLPDYQTAMQYGLTPKYTHPGQLAGAYKQELGRAVAGQQLVKDLVATGKLVPARSAGPDFMAVNLPFSSKGYYAEPTLAKVLNGQFENAEKNFGQKLAAGGASLSKKMQEVVLSGGVPNTDINFFSIGQLVKNLTAGDLKAVPAFIRANFDSSSIKWFEEKSPIIQKMSQHGVDVSHRVGNMAEMYKNMVASPTIKEALGKGWQNVFEKKTFASFIPQLQISTFERAYKEALSKGLSEMEAGELAAQTTRAFYGLFENTGRSKTAQDALSALFFAPKFREGIIRTLWNTGRSITTEIKNPAFAMNRKLATGMAISYAMYNLANKKLNGHYMWDNEPGREFALRIPLPSGKIAYVDFMPSFLSLPRNIVSGAKALATGDVSTGVQKATSMLSQPVQLLSQLGTNKDYFGNPIYNDSDSGVDKVKDIGKYILPNVSHPYVKLATDTLFPNPQFPKPLVQSIMEASELPVKFSSQDQLSRQQFYDALDNKTKANKAAQKKIQPIYEKVQQLKKEGKLDEAQAIVDKLSDEDYNIYKKIRSSDKRRSTTAAEAKMYKTYEKVQELKNQGKTDEAQAIVDDLSDDDYQIYKLVKNRFSD